MIADFGLSRVMDEDKLTMLTEVCGTPGYMAPEIFKRSAYFPPLPRRIVRLTTACSRARETCRHLGDGCDRLLPPVWVHALRP